MAKKASVRDVRRANRALLVRRLILAGETSRSDLGEDTGLSPSTVTHVVNELIEERTVREEGFLDSVGGRRRVIVRVDPAAALVFGADISETEIKTEAFDLTLYRLASRVTPFANRSIEPSSAIAILADHARSMLSELDIERSKVMGLGLGVPGIVEIPAKGRGDQLSVIHASTIGWDEVVLEGLSDELGFPVLIDNGAKTTTQAESWFGSARGSEHAIVVLIGAGAGAGIITNGRLYRGYNSSAGEWGHTKISVDGRRCRCGSYGCVDTFVGASAALHLWSGETEAWVGRETEGIEALFQALDAGDARAVRVMEDLVTHLGFALSNLVNMYNPQKIIVSGWFGDRIAERYLEKVAESTRRFSLKQPGNEAVVERSQLGQDAVALGAATLPLDSFIETGWPQRKLGSPKHQ